MSKFDKYINSTTPYVYINDKSDTTQIPLITYSNNQTIADPDPNNDDSIEDIEKKFGKNVQIIYKKKPKTNYYQYLDQKTSNDNVSPTNEITTDQNEQVELSCNAKCTKKIAHRCVFIFLLIVWCAIYLICTRVFKKS